LSQSHAENFIEILRKFSDIPPTVQTLEKIHGFLDLRSGLQTEYV